MIEITHNDLSKPSPYVIPITFYVMGNWACSGCTCPCKYDPVCDGVVSDIVDLVATVDAAFRNVAPVVDADCPAVRTDVDADGQTTIIDVVKVANVAFRNETAASNYVDPCQ